MRNKIIFRAIILPFIVLCLTHPAICQDTQDIAQRLDRIERDMRILQKNVYKVQKSSEKSIDPVAVFKQLDKAKEQIKVLFSNMEHLEFQNSSFNEKLVALTSDMDLKISELKKEIKNETAEDKTLDNVEIQLNSDDNREAGEDSKNSKQSYLEETADKKTIEMEYVNAHSLLKDRRYEDAKKKFREFVTKYKNSDFIGNAYYWLGETYFLSGQYEEASMEYLRGFQKDQRGSRAPDNLLKLGISLSMIQKFKGACTSFEKLKKEFPTLPNNLRASLEENLKKSKCHKILRDK